MVKIKGEKILLDDGSEVILGDDGDFKMRYDPDQDRFEIEDPTGNTMYLNKGQSGDLLLAGAPHNQLSQLTDDDHQQYILEDGTRPMSGNLDMGDNDVINANRFVSNNQPIQESMHKGLYTGGDLTRVGGRDIKISSGIGYLHEDSTKNNFKVDFPEQTVTIPSGTTKTVTIHKNGDVHLHDTASSVDLSANIALGTVIADSNSIVFLSEHSQRVGEKNERDHIYAIDVVGPVAVNGGIASIGGASDLGMDVTAAEFYIADERQSVSGTSDISFNYWYRDGSGGWNSVEDQNEIDPDKYDDGSGTLADVPSGEYKKDMLFIVPKGSNAEYHVVYGQETYIDENSAQSGNNPITNSQFESFALRSTGIVIESGTTKIDSFVDARPFLGQFQAKASSVSDHGNLSGLEDDDHPQYTTKPETQDIATAQNSNHRDKFYYNHVTYTGKNSLPTAVFYQRIYLTEGQTFDTIENYHVSTGTGDREVGIYSDNNRRPDTLLESSGVQTVNIATGQFTKLQLQNDWTAPSTGYYWIAFIGNSGANAKMTATTINGNIAADEEPFHPFMTEARSATNGLPSTATPEVSNSAVPYFALVTK